MSHSLRAYNDAALSSQLTKLAALQKSDGSSGAVDFVIYLGSTAIGRKIEAASNPGVDAIVLTVVDDDGATGQTDQAVKLANSVAGLDSAVGGAPLTLGTEILSGTGNAVEVHVRVEATSLLEGNYTDLSLDCNNLVESDA